MMSVTYRKAESVLVWIGEPSESSEKAWRWIDEFAKWNMNNDAISQLTALRYRRSIEKVSSAIKSKKTELAPTDVILAIQELLARPWFHRVWTFQEIILAKKAKILCG
jgi:hypothetical protein